MALGTLGASAPVSAAPTLERTWGTYFGDSGEEFTNGLAIDAAGNLYVIGSTDSKTGIATPGAHQPMFGGQFSEDAYLAKFDPEGTLVWATYFGGPYSDYGAGIAVGADSVIIVGRSDSTTGIATPGAFQETAAGGDDGFVAAFTLDGALKWSTYIGTTSPLEGARGVALDAEGQIYVVGALRANLPGLGTPGAHQPAHGGAGEDGYLVKFTPEGEVVWGTYYGGPVPASLDSVSINALGELYAAGVAYDPTDAIPSPDAHQTSFGGVGDIQTDYLVRFDPDTGARVWGTYYGGDSQEFEPVIVAMPQGGVLLTGYTHSAANIATPGAHQPEYGGDGDAFLARFDAAGVRMWGTYYGGVWGESARALAVDASGAVYFGGQTGEVDSLATPDGYLPTNQGLSDAFIAKFSGDGVRLWGTYYGGPEVDDAVALAVDPLYRLHLLGGARSTTGIATPGAHDEVHLGDSYETFLVQFEQPIGAACAGSDECGGMPCVDGVCCDSPCGDGADDCQTCSAAAGAVADGVCTPLAAEVVCRPSAGSCDAAELCPGDAGVCPDDAPVADGEPCEDGVCSAGACVPAETSTGGASTGDTSGESTAGESSSGSGDTTGAPEVTTTAVEPPTTGPDAETSGEGETDSGGSQSGEDAGCGCRSDADGTLLGAPLLLLLARRRRAVALA